MLTRLRQTPAKKGDQGMKVTGFNGSPNKKGNTSILINYVFRELEKEGIETELISLAEKKAVYPA